MSDAPPKFITENGVRKLNPEFKKWKATQGGADGAAPPPPVAPQMKNDMTSLPVVCNMQDFAQLGAGAQMDAKFQKAQEAYAATAQAVGSDMDQLGQVFAKYEIPMGLLGRLQMVETYACMEILCDDSGSMGSSTDSKHPTGRPMTRWEEAKKNISVMFELLAYINCPPMHIRFLNRPDDVVIQRNPGENPQQFLQRVHGILDQTFARGPSGTTPYKERGSESLARYPGQKVIRYWFSDGVPNGGEEAVEAIKKMVKNRPNPQQNPLILVACTNDDSQVEWMSDVEECAKYCSASDDFGDESTEVLKDQGEAFPYSYGLWLLCLIIGAADEVLDAMDESSPLALASMSEIAGYQLSPQDYDYYLNKFFEAQKRKPHPQSNEDKLKAEYAKKFEGIRDQFHKAPIAGAIPLVQEYRKKMMEASSSGCVIA